VSERKLTISAKQRSTQESPRVFWGFSAIGFLLGCVKTAGSCLWFQCLATFSPAFSFLL
jgi:hypothetical protein